MPCGGSCFVWNAFGGGVSQKVGVAKGQSIRLTRLIFCRPIY